MSVFLSPSSSSSFVIDERGKLLAFGQNHYGQLGIGNAKYSREPVEVSVSCVIKQIISTKKYSLILDEEGIVWGTGRYLPEIKPKDRNHFQFKQIENLPIITRLETDGIKWFAITIEGEIITKCTIEKNAYLHHLLSLRNIQLLSVSKRIILALDLHGKLWGWSSESSKIFSFTPQIIEFEENVPKCNILNIGVAETICYIHFSNGELWKCKDFGEDTPFKWEKEGFHKVSDLPLINKFVFGAGHCLAIDKSGLLWGWGDNCAGELGFISRSDSYFTPQERGIKHSPNSEIFAGNSYSMLQDGNKLFVFGSNANGQLGIELEDEYYNRIAEHNLLLRVPVTINKTKAIK